MATTETLKDNQNHLVPPPSFGRPPYGLSPERLKELIEAFPRSEEDVPALQEQNAAQVQTREPVSVTELYGGV